MSIQTSANSFCQMLSHSGLLSDTQLLVVEQKFPSSSRTSTPRIICDWLLQEGVITEWHAEKLLQAKFRGFFLGPYKLLNRVARGGMSTIYAAQHKESGQIHALKVLPPARTNTASYLPRLQREAAITQRLQHPNIVRVFGFYSESDGQDAVHFIAMEYMQGRDLFETVNAEGPLSCRQASEYIRQAAIGLEHAHQAGLVHRDIKPGNLFVPDDGVLRILDLGLAQDFDSDENLTREFNERVLGTADYLAPEQAADSHTVDRRADLYSLGCSLYFLLTGQPPFTEGTLVQRLVAHQTKTPVPVTAFRSDVPPELISILNSMIEKNRNRRVSTAIEVAQRLGTLLDTTRDDARLDTRPAKKVADQCSNGPLEQNLCSADELSSKLAAVETRTTRTSDSWPTVLQQPDVVQSDAVDTVLPRDSSGPVDDDVGFLQLLKRIEQQCRTGGIYSEDPRSVELLQVALRLQANAPAQESATKQINGHDKIVVPEKVLSITESPEQAGSFGRLLLGVGFLLAWICIVALLVNWMQSR